MEAGLPPQLATGTMAATSAIIALTRIVRTETVVSDVVEEAAAVSNSAPLTSVAQRGPIQVGEVTTYHDFVNRSVVGDNIERHELWRHANLWSEDLATERLSTAHRGNVGLE